MTGADNTITKAKAMAIIPYDLSFIIICLFQIVLLHHIAAFIRT
jgi:hypothetical protein